ncbi:MAG: DegT/DnrJ/EryC1/StrS family aminotransferase [Verrucomicrobia bacterium]|nr:DegT/DnrJ/EryC1/StrS family aminotransferase [Verrucomicrobiota bacterium]
MNIPLTRVELLDDDRCRLNEVIDSGWLMQGARVELFEKAVADYCGVAHAVATSSGTTALHLALLLAGIQPGDEVVVPSFSWIASANVAAYCGAQPVFCDVAPETYNMTAGTVAAALSAKTKAILVVHQFGMPCELESIATLARDRGLVVIEDAACAIGSVYRGEPIGNCRYSIIVCFSFHPRKVLTTGEGGMLLTNNHELASRARALRNHGMNGAQFSWIGYNYRMTDIQAALGIGQIARLPTTVQRRRNVARHYRTLLALHTSIGLPVEPADCQTNYQSFMVRLKDNVGSRRDQIAQSLNNAGVATRPGIAPSHLQPCYSVTHKQPQLPCTEVLAQEGLVLPLFPSMTPEQVQYVCDQFKQAMEIV